MDLWSMIPIGVHHYTILSTMVSSILLENTLWKRYHLEILGNEIIRYPMHASFSFYHSNLQLAYITQAWILKFKTCAMQANIWNAHSNASTKFMSFHPLLMCSKFFIDPLPLSYLSPYVNFSTLCYLFTIFVHYFSPFVINDHKGSKCR